MTTIRRGSTQSGKLVIGPAEPITPVNLNPIPPPMTAKATIESFQTPVDVGQAAHCVAKVTQGKPDKFRWQYLMNGTWKTAGEVPAVPPFTYDYIFLGKGNYPIRLQSVVAGNVTDTTGTPRTIVVLKNPDPPQPPTTITFRASNGQYVCAEEGGNHAVNANRDAAGPWETFKRFPQPDGRFAYQSDKGYYLTAENGGGGALLCNRQVVGPNECWHELLTNGGIALQSANGHFMCAEEGGGGEVNVTRSVVGAWETFNAPVTPPPGPPGTVTRVHPDGHVFRTDDGAAWRWKGVSAFQLCDRWLRGEDLNPFLSAYQGYNTLRVWSYVEGPNWTDPTWNSPTPDEAVAFVKEMNRLGWYVEWTLLTSSNKNRINHALDEIHAFTAANLTGLFLEATNEPEVQNPDTTFIDASLLRHALEDSGYPYTNGCYTDGAKRWWGTYFTCHTQRNNEWPRYCHDGYDYWVKPADAPAGAQAVHVPCIFDEPAKTQDVSGDKVSDWKAYFGGCAFFGAGATYHSKTGKFAQPPTAEEAQLAASALVGLGAFPADAPADFRYSRITENTLRTYIMGNYMVRIRPTTLQAPQPGWTMIDSAGILWRR